MKNRNNRWRSWPAVAVGVLAVSSSAYTFLLNDDTGLPLKWRDGTIALRLMMGDSPPLRDGSTYNDSVRTAAESWNSKIGSVQFQTSIATGAGSENNQLNEVFFAENVFGRTFEDDAVAVATRWRVGNRRVESDVIFNNKYKYDSYRGNLRAEAGAWVYDVQRVALHELGHALGLTHPDEAGQTLSAVMNSRVSNTDSLTSDDIQGAQLLYGAPASVPANDNLANATVLDLGSSPALAVNGTTAQATKEAAEPNHAANTGGHSVWFKWTAAANGGLTVNTRGSYFNTTLGVYTGTTVSGLTGIVSNDDIEATKVQASLVTFYARSGTTYLFAVDGRDGESGGLTLNLSFDPNASIGPIIVTHPVSLSATTGSSVSFSVLANGSEPLAYQWNLNGTPIVGATTVTYNLASVTTAQGGNYTVTVSNPAGTIISNGASLTVNAPPPPPPAPSGGGGGGGGGAPSLWFCAVLAALGLGRFLSRGRR